MKRMWTTLLALGLFAGLSAQSVTFYSPMEWLTQRDGAMVAKVQFDTAKVNKKTAQFTLSLVTNGSKKRLASKSVTVKDYSMDIDLGKIDQVRLGGRDFAVIDWAIPQTKEKGVMGPVGIVNLEKIGAFDTVLARKAGTGTTRSGIAGLLKDSDYSAVGSISVAYAWGDKGLYAVCKGGTAGTTVTVGIDGKNAKNGYITYSDRFVHYAFGKDSLWVTHYKRAFANDSIKYTLAEWNTVVSREVANGIVTIEIPWYDIGMIPPTADRRVGISVFVGDDKGAVTATFPKGAGKEMPGSWGDLVFKQ